MNKTKIFERVEEAKSTLIDLNNYHLNQLEYIDKLRKELKEISIKKYNEKPDTKEIKDFDFMINQIQGGIMRTSDFQLKSLDAEINIVKNNDIMIDIMIMLKEFSQDDMSDINKSSNKIKQIIEKFKEHNEMQKW